MALSGTINGSFSGPSTSQARPILKWSANQNIQQNRSTVTVSLIYERYSSNWRSWNNFGHTITINIDGNSSSTNKNFDLRNRSSQIIWTRTLNVNHNSDGTKTLDLSASGNTGVNLGSFNFSGKAYLTTIPRSSGFSLRDPNTGNVISSINYGQPVRIDINPASSNFTHTIKAQWNGQYQTIASNITYNQHDWTVPNSYMDRIPNSTSTRGRIWVETFSNGSEIGQRSSSLTTNVPSSVTPHAESLSTSISGSGYDNTIGKYLQNNSRVQASFSSRGTYQSTIVSNTITISRGNDSHTINGTSGTSGLLSESGSYTVKATTRDSRGRSSSTSTTFTATAYSPPAITSFNAQRNAGNQTTVTITRSGNHSPLNGDNTLTVKTQRRPAQGNWTTINTSTTNSSTFSNTVTSTGNGIAEAFEFRAIAEDEVGNRADSTGTVGTQRAVIDIHKNDGVGIGRFHEKGVLDVDGEAYFRGKVDVEPDPNAPDTDWYPFSISSGSNANTTGVGWYNSSDNLAASLTTTDINTNFPWMQIIAEGGLDVLGDGGLTVNGAQIESAGESSNGHFVRFYNGTQICWVKGIKINNAATSNHEHGHLYLYQYWNLPVPFVRDMFVTGEPDDYLGNTNDRLNMRFNPELDVVTAYVVDPNDKLTTSSSVSNVRMFAIGRWF